MGQNFRFVHAADLHLDSPLLGLEEFEDAPVTQIRDATRDALKNLVELCLREQVQFLLVAGDVYDGDWKSMATGRFFADQMVRLTRAGIPVYLIKGNHDAASVIAKEVTLPNVHTFSARKPETLYLHDIAVAIHGQSFRDREVKEDLSANYPEPKAGYFNIGMLHTCATGGSTLHEAYAPCSLEGLLSKRYDYWALGHVHQRQVLNSDPPIVFPGNLQGRHVREPAPDGKGATLVQVQDGRIVALDHVPLDVVRWMVLEVDLSGSQSKEEAMERIAASVRTEAQKCEGRLLAVRLNLIGRCAASLAIHQNLALFDSDLRAYVQGSVGDVWLEEVRIAVKAPAAERAFDQDSLGELIAFIRTAAERDRLGEAAGRAAALKSKLEGAAPKLVDELGLTDASLIASLLPDVEETILALTQEAAS